MARGGSVERHVRRAGDMPVLLDEGAQSNSYFIILRRRMLQVSGLLEEGSRGRRQDSVVLQLLTPRPPPQTPNLYPSCKR